MLNLVMASLWLVYSYSRLFMHKAISRHFTNLTGAYDLACYELIKIRRRKVTFYTWNPMRMVRVCFWPSVFFHVLDDESIWLVSANPYQQSILWLLILCLNLIMNFSTKQATLKQTQEAVHQNRQKTISIHPKRESGRIIVKITVQIR